MVAKAPLPRVHAFAQERGWRHLRLHSSAGNDYNRDYHRENVDGSQNPVLNVFTCHDGEIRHFWCSEPLYAAREAGQDPRHVDFIWPVWRRARHDAEGPRNRLVTGSGIPRPRLA